MHVKQPDGKYHYGPDWEHGGTPAKFGYSLMGTGTAIMNKVYLEMYHDPEILPKGMIEYIDQVQNCEDIGMNVMVTKFLEDVSWPQCSALSVVAHGRIKNLQEEARKQFLLMASILLLYTSINSLSYVNHLSPRMSSTPWFVGVKVGTAPLVYSVY